MAHGTRTYSIRYSIEDIIAMLKQGKKLKYGGLKSSEDYDGYVTKWGYYIQDEGQIELSTEDIIDIITKLTSEV